MTKNQIISGFVSCLASSLSPPILRNMNLSIITTIELMKASWMNKPFVSVPFANSVAMLTAAAVELASDVIITVM